MTSRAFLSSSDPETSEDLCLICLTALDKDTKKALGVNPWNKLIEIAKKWQELDIPESDVHYNFTTVYKRIVNLPAPKQDSNYFVHNNCQLSMRGTKYDRYAKRYAKAPVNVEEAILPEIPTPTRELRRKSSHEKVKICFICNTTTAEDDNTFNNKGLGRCSQNTALEKLEKAKANHLNNSISSYHSAALRFEMATSGAAHDVFAADIYYHKSCYNNFIKFTEEVSLSEHEIVKKEKMDAVLYNFLRYLKQKIIMEKNAYLLIDLLQDIQDLSEEAGLDEPIVETTLALRRLIETNLDKKISFHLIDKKLMAYSSEVNRVVL